MGFLKRYFSVTFCEKSECGLKELRQSALKNEENGVIQVAQSFTESPHGDAVFFWGFLAAGSLLKVGDICLLALGQLPWIMQNCVSVIDVPILLHPSLWSYLLHQIFSHPPVHRRSPATLEDTVETASAAPQSQVAPVLDWAMSGIFFCHCFATSLSTWTERCFT